MATVEDTLTQVKQAIMRLERYVGLIDDTKDDNTITGFLNEIELSDMIDVEGTPTSGDLLVYDGQKWVSKKELIIDNIRHLLDQNYTYESTLPRKEHEIVHNLDSFRLSIDIYVKDETTNSWMKDLVNVQLVDKNTVKIFLIEEANILFIATRIK